jgi:hypothetical protein
VDAALLAGLQLVLTPTLKAVRLEDLTVKLSDQVSSADDDDDRQDGTTWRHDSEHDDTRGLSRDDRVRGSRAGRVSTIETGIEIEMCSRRRRARETHPRARRRWRGRCRRAGGRRAAC